MTNTEEKAVTQTAVQRFQDRVVQMIDKGNTGWHISPGEKWWTMTIEEKCESILQMWDAPRQRKDFVDSYGVEKDSLQFRDRGMKEQFKP